MFSGQTGYHHGYAPANAAYDGPTSEPGRSRSGSRTRSTGAQSRAPSETRGVIVGYDAKTNRPPVLNRNIDFGGMAYMLRNQVVSHFISVV